jgi:Putative glutamine amidotransferase
LPDDLYRYHAIIVDDLEAEQFTPDQMALVQKFVSQRGGGFLMLGGQESFAGGKYDRTPLGDLLPVYLDRLGEPHPGSGHRLMLAREGWLQPWVRLRSTETDERKRLDEMPAFQTLNRVRGVKPGATLLAAAVDEQNHALPALVEQRFGKGRSVAMTIGDLWRWALKPSEQAAADQAAVDQAAATVRRSDLDKAWRQLIRSLVADVPERIEVEPKHEHDDPGQGVRLAVRAHDAKFEPLDNATVTIKVTSPAGETLELSGAASDQRPGSYEASYVPHQPGAYRAEVIVAAPDGSELGRRRTGWTSDPAAAEFRTVRPNRELLARLAEETGGQVIPAAELAAFVADLPNRKLPITEPSITPLWHQAWVFLLAIACLCGEWAIRRWRGLA